MKENKKLLFSVVALTVAASAAYAQQERLYSVENLVRVGYDDNTRFNDQDQDSSVIISELLNLGATLRFDGATQLDAYYQGIYKSLPDADPDNLSSHDASVKFAHELSENMGLTVADSFRYSQRDAQSGVAANANYIENTLRSALSLGVADLTELRIGGEYTLREWDEDVYGVTAGNNYDRYVANVSVFQELKADTKGMLGVDYSNTEYDGNRGSMDVVSLMAGIERDFNQSVYGYGRVGASFIDADNVAGDSSSTAPYLSAGLNYAASDKTSVNGSVGYTTRNADNSFYNVQEMTSFTLGVKHQLSKIALTSALSYNMGSYKSDYALAAGASDADDNFVQFSLRGSYELTENNFIELGYIYGNRDTDVGSDYERNQVDLGWRWKM
ncbi:MAG: outer membrane beta-barrel protein [Pontiellaceae bacterium]|nr:outer membrane beta-barrel protein [Pontiellaceae bacterium]